MSLVRDRESEVVLETGTRSGATTRLIPHIQPQAKIHIRDLTNDITSDEVYPSKFTNGDLAFLVDLMGCLAGTSPRLTQEGCSRS